MPSSFGREPGPSDKTSGRANIATPGAGQSGNFIITSEGIDVVLGGGPSVGGVPSITFRVQSGDVIEIMGLGQVTLTPS